MATSIQREQRNTILSDREQARDKLHVFYGSRDNFTHGLLETIMNARDEIKNNFPSGTISITLHEDRKTITVLDSGRGILLHDTTDGIPNYAVTFETLFAGGNYKNLEDNIKSTGTNGCGATTLNFTSVLDDIWSYKGDMMYHVLYKDGGILQTYEELPNTSGIDHGTKITFALDPLMYTNVIYDPLWIDDILNKISSTSTNIKYVYEYTDNDGNKVVKEYLYESALEYMNENCVSTLTQNIVLPKEMAMTKVKKEEEEYDENDEVDVVFSLSTEPIQETYLNGTYLREGGTIVNGFVNGIINIFNKDMPKGKKITPSDVLMCFNFHIMIDSNNPEFEGQTKFQTKNKTYYTIVSDYMIKHLGLIKNEKPDIYKQMLEQLKKINDLNTSNIEKIKKIKKDLEEKSSNFCQIKKFIDCRSKDTNVREIFIVEGDSAQGSCKLARDSSFQAIIPVRGKILNCLKANIEDILSSDIIKDLIRVLGCGIEITRKENAKLAKELSTFNINNLNWNKVIICTDADVDGFQIRTLILTALYVLCPQLIIQGKVFIADTPLFEITHKKKSYFAYTEKEKDDILANLEGKVHIARSKGLTT